MSRLRAEWGLYTRKYQTSAKNVTVWWYYIYDSEGKRHLLSTGETNKNTAMREVARRIAAGTALPQKILDKTAGPTVREFAAGVWDWENGWVKGKRLKDEVTPAYAADHAGRIKLHILPALGDRRIRSVGVSDLEPLFQKLAETLAGGTVNFIFKGTKAVFDEAFRLDIIKANPFDRMALYKLETKRKDNLSTEQAFLLLQRRWWADEAMWAINLTAAVTGARVSELCALRVGSVHFDRVVIKGTIRKLIGPVDDTKTGAGGMRSSAIPPVVGAVLITLAKGRDPAEFLFRDHRHLDVSIPNKELKTAMDLASKDGVTFPLVTFHGWRHFVESTLSSRILPDPISLHIGHAVPGVKGTYLHQTEDHIQTCLKALTEVWSGFRAQ